MDVVEVEEEEVKEEEEEELVPESAEWVQFRDPTGKIYFWNRRTHSTSWNHHRALRSSGSARELTREGFWYWYRVSRVSRFDLPTLPPG